MQKREGQRTMNYQTAMLQLPLVREGSATGGKVRTPQDVLAVCEDMTTLAQEAFVVLSLNSRNKLLNKTLCTLGLADACLVHPREVFRQAITDGAAAVVLVHNHPSGDPNPSAEDIRITKQMVEAGKIIDIKVLDSVVLGRGDRSVFSLREEGLVKF